MWRFYYCFVIANVLKVSVKLKQKKTVHVIRMWFSILDEATNFTALCEAGPSVFFGNTSLDRTNHQYHIQPYIGKQSHLGKENTPWKMAHVLPKKLAEHSYFYFKVLFILSFVSGIMRLISSLYSFSLTFFPHYRQHPLCVVKITFVLSCSGRET